MNAAQFESFVNQYEKLVYTVCWQLVRDRELAQDLSQETFLSAWRSIERCPEGHEAQWLARIAANKAKGHFPAHCGWSGAFPRFRPAAPDIVPGSRRLSTGRGYFRDCCSRFNLRTQLAYINSQLRASMTKGDSNGVIRS